jgi:phosphate transport system substrate-binding protein
MTVKRLGNGETFPVLAVLLLLLSLVSVACVGGSNGGSTVAGSENQQADATGSSLQDTITISGAFALYPLVIKWSEEFQKVHPNVRFDITAGGAGNGMTDVLGGLANLAMFSREPSATELESGANLVPMAIDAVVPRPMPITRSERSYWPGACAGKTSPTSLSAAR